MGNVYCMAVQLQFMPEPEVGSVSDNAHELRMKKEDRSGIHIDVL